MLVDQLRPGSRLAQVRMADDAWTSTDYFLAGLSDLLRDNTWVLSNKDVEPSKRNAQPEPMDRPVDARRVRDTASKAVEKARAFKSRHSVRAK